MAAPGAAGGEDRPLVSIIVRAEGQAARARSLASLVAQTWDPLEVVVVEAEGESPGGWPGDAGRLRLRKARAAGGGRGAALNAGLDAASGELVGFLDGLDAVNPEHVARLAARLAAEPEAGAAVVVPGLGMVPTLDLLDLATGRVPPLSDLLIRRRVVAAGARFDESLELCGDWEFCLQVARIAPIVRCPGDAAAARPPAPGGELAAEARRAERARVWERWKQRLSGTELAALVDRLAGEAERAGAAVAVVERRALDVETELQLVLESRSWSLTRPLRAWAAASRRARGQGPLAARSLSAMGRPAGASIPVVGGNGAPLVSVILPVFNACRSDPAFLAEAIASVARQTYPAVELIVVDDGSTDDSAALARQILDRHERLSSRLVTTLNGGQSAARNHGVTLARGGLLSFIDQDDVFLPTKLATVVPCLLDQADVVYTDADIVTAGQRTGVRCFHRTLGCGQPHPKRSVEDILFGNAFVMPGLTTMRRELFERVGGFDPELSGYEDDDLFLRLFERGRVRYLPVSTLLWRMHDENYSFSARMVRSRRHYFEKLIRLHAREGRDRLRTRGIALRFLGEFLSEAARQYRGGSPQYRDNLAGAREVRRYLPRWRAALAEARWLGWAVAARMLARRGARRDEATES